MSTVNAALSSPAQEESDVLKLQQEMELLKVELADLKEKLIEVENRGIFYCHVSFHWTKLKMMIQQFYFIPDSQTIERS